MDALIAGIIGAAFGSAPGLYSAWQTRKTNAALARVNQALAEKTKAETKHVDLESSEHIAQIAMQLITPLETRVNQLVCDLQASGTRITDMSEQIVNLRKQIDEKDRLIARQEHQIRKLQEGVRKLQEQLKKLGLKPEFELEEEPKDASN